jgi:hypothetical protein
MCIPRVVKFLRLCVSFDVDTYLLDGWSILNQMWLSRHACVLKNCVHLEHDLWILMTWVAFLCLISTCVCVQHHPLGKRQDPTTYGVNIVTFDRVWEYMRLFFLLSLFQSTITHG